jgi:hypothetical protein
MKANLGDRKPSELSADAGYFSEDNASYLEGQRIDPYIATGRQKHGEPEKPVDPSGATIRDGLPRTFSFSVAHPKTPPAPLTSITLPERLASKPQQAPSPTGAPEKHSQVRRQAPSLVGHTDMFFSPSWRYEIPGEGNRCSRISDPLDSLAELDCEIDRQREAQNRLRPRRPAHPGRRSALTSRGAVEPVRPALRIDGRTRPRS